MVADTLALADHFDAKMFDLVGHDWGAGVAWATAIAHPDRLRTLTVVSVPHPAAYAKASEDPNGEQTRKKGYVDTFVTPGVATTLANDLRSDSGVSTPAVSVPTLFLYGTADCCLGRDAADLTDQYVTGPYTYEVLDRVDHWIPETAAPALNRLLLHHLER